MEVKVGEVVNEPDELGELDYWPKCSAGKEEREHREEESRKRNSERKKKMLQYIINISVVAKDKGVGMALMT